MTTNDAPDRSTLIERVRKVMALSQSPNQNEAQSALQKASDLIRRYNLSEAEIQSALNSEPSSEICSALVILEEKDARDQWNVRLAVAISEANLCKALFGNQVIEFIGRRREVEVVKELYIQFRTIAFTMMAQESRKFTWAQLAAYHESGKKKAKRDWIKSYLLGFATAVSEGLKKDLASFSSESAGQALMITRKAETDQYLAENHPESKEFTSRKVDAIGTAYYQGKASGRQAVSDQFTPKLEN